MKSKALILVPNPKNATAPVVSLYLNCLSIKAFGGEEFSYAISSEDGSVVQKGMFQGNIEVLFDSFSSSNSPNLFQLDIFNAEHHYAYNFNVQ